MALRSSRRRRAPATAADTVSDARGPDTSAASGPFGSTKAFPSPATVVSRPSGGQDHPSRVDAGDMAGCCDPRGCDTFFGPRFASRRARQYRMRGLDATARRMVNFLTERGVHGATVLEIGGGVGQLQLELLRRRASHATNLELVDAYEEPARELAAEAGMSGRVSRLLLDIAATPHQVPPADIVVLHRVVCCYPDYPRLLAAAADSTRRLLVFSYLSRNIVSRALLAAQNAMFALTGRSFRAFAHSPEAMLKVLTERGLRVTHRYEGPVWQVAGLERVA